MRANTEEDNITTRSKAPARFSGASEKDGIMGGKLCLAARWAIPIVGEPIRDAVVVIDNGIIEGVYARPQFNTIYKNQQIERAEDYKEAVIMPGLINMHSHLDYSALRAFDTDLPFFDWIEGLVTRSRDWTSDKWFQSALYGARLAAFTGTSTIVDSSYSGQAAKAIAQVGLRGVVGLEIFGLCDADSDTGWTSWLSRFEALRDTDFPPLKEALEKQSITLTVSPHAPYTVCPSLWLKAATWAKKFSLPVLAHLAESEEECQWLAAGQERVQEFLAFSMRTDIDSEKLKPRWAGRGLTPVQHLKNYGLLNEWLVVAHAVHTDDADLTILSEHNVKVAHCPRSNARLKNGLAPYSKMLEHGITVGLGTDSLASNDDLNLLAEAQFALNAHRLKADDDGEEHLTTARQLIEAMTMEAAIALKMDHLVGSLQAGKRADIAVFALPPTPLSDGEKEALCPYNLVMSGGARLRDLLVDGQFVVSEGKLNRS
ncbi:MAG: hypothetical protein C0469_04280 [Cyanobacteria bacterium DS2.3.42]|nr:hypothetical protein [Cyanobacteria bacterium DS2.3.42]